MDDFISSLFCRVFLSMDSPPREHITSKVTGASELQSEAARLTCVRVHFLVGPLHLVDCVSRS